MADTLKQLVSTDANRMPTNNTPVTLYTVPPATQAMLSRVIIANNSAAAVAFRIAITPSGVVLAAQHYIAYDISCPANDTINFAIGAGLATGDFVTVRTATGSALTFVAFGIEVV